MKAVIVAGGRGERMGDLTRGTPKPMLPVGGKPILERQLDLLRENGFTEVFLLLGYRADEIRSYFGGGEKWGVEIRYCLETQPMGTAGSVKQLSGVIQENFLVLYGDLLVLMHLADLIDFHRRHNGIGTLTVHPNDHPYDSDLVIVNEQAEITGFTAKDQKREFCQNLVSAAVYVLSPRIFDYIPDEPCDFAKDIFPALIRDSEKLYAYKTSEYIKDVGTPQRIQEVEKDVSEGKPFRWLKSRKRPAIFMDRDGTLVKPVDLLHRVDQLDLFSFSAPAVKAINRSDYLGFVVTNQPVVARNLCDLTTVNQIHAKMETLLGREGAYLNGIYFCPHHPDGGYPEENPLYKKDCGCRKPKVGLIESANREYNVDLESSWMIGDSTTDVQTGINAGLQTILVTTGQGGRDQKFSCSPDFTFDHLGAAVDFILKGRFALRPHVEQITEIVKKNGQNPFIIAVGGLSRSGKSTFIGLLEKGLRKEKISSEILRLDNWLINIGDRSGDMTVRERYRYEELGRDMKDLLAGRTIPLNLYDSYSRKVTGHKLFSLDHPRCLILDGVCALDHEKLRDIAHLKIYVETDEKRRKQRFLDFYRWKGLMDQAAEIIYQQRLSDEALFIKGSRAYADIVIKQ